MTQLVVSNHFSLPIRIYYEDTDAGGVVYHAGYIRFMERARTEWLRQLGFEQHYLMNALNIAFAVRSLSIEYLKPAKFDDQIEVTARVKHLGRASIEFEQTVTRRNLTTEAELLITASVKVVCVQLDKFKSTAIPHEIRSLLV
ncbi:tol-pal system-associated acyl-CoA thioesterase [Thiofilum flexile]|uniref:tol-pal system-associated acyl-CoA thioesterase n=1 Tax=Thiofilum flexile TaxID=125627 RepID=UPI000375C97E|nr:tol-pal system-associated acyl-CoA thioesterase [Thiofilum flexile]